MHERTTDSTPHTHALSLSPTPPFSLVPPDHLNRARQKAHKVWERRNKRSVQDNLERIGFRKSAFFVRTSCENVERNGAFSDVALLPVTNLESASMTVSHQQHKEGGGGGGAEDDYAFFAIERKGKEASVPAAASSPGEKGMVARFWADREEKREQQQQLQQQVQQRRRQRGHSPGVASPPVEDEYAQAQKRGSRQHRDRDHGGGGGGRHHGHRSGGGRHHSGEGGQSRRHHRSSSEEKEQSQQRHHGSENPYNHHRPPSGVVRHHGVIREEEDEEQQQQQQPHRQQQQQQQHPLPPPVRPKPILAGSSKREFLMQRMRSKSGKMKHFLSFSTLCGMGAKLATDRLPPSFL